MNAGMITSSPGLRSIAAIVTSSAAVPLHTAIPCSTPAYDANIFSNFCTKGPSDETHPVSIHSPSSSFSLLPNSGSFTGIIGYNLSSEISLVILFSVWPLFNLYNGYILDDLKTMSAIGEQNYISPFKDTGGDKFFIIAVKVNP